MARYKNVRRTASVRRAVRYWWNVVKNFDERVYDQDFFDIVAYNLKRDEVAAIIGGNFSDKDLKPLMEAKEDKLELDRDNVGFMLKRIWNEKPLRKGCRAVLKIMRDRILRKLVPSEEDARFERHFAELCRFLGLDRVEADLFMLMYVRSATVFDDFPEDEDTCDRPQYYAMALDRSYPEVLSALSKRGRLARYNCMNENYWFNQQEFGCYFEGTEGAPLDERYYRANTEEVLPWSFFGRLSSEDGAILKEMLRAHKRGGRLNILFYGVPGAGKTSFARSLAAEAGLRIYDLLQGEENGTNISAETRLAGIQIFNARMTSGGNLLLWWPPGTGKTEYVKYLGSELKSKVVVKMGSDLLDKYVGGTEERIADAFAEAEAEKAILFLDEIDGLLQSRQRADHSWEVTQVNELLHQMENFGGVMIGATNFFENLDPAVLRRFTFKVEFGYLDDAGKRSFFERMFGSKLSEAEAARLDAVASLAPGDFRTVRQSLYYLGGGVDNAMRISELEKEAAVKRGARSARIGF